MGKYVTLYLASESTSMQSMPGSGGVRGLGLPVHVYCMGLRVQRGVEVTYDGGSTAGPRATCWSSCRRCR